MRLGISNPKKEDVDAMIWELDEDNEQCVKWRHFETNIDRIHKDKVAHGRCLVLAVDCICTSAGEVACCVPPTRALWFFRIPCAGGS